jgi:hypothetical protein
MEELSIENWNNIDIEDLRIILEALSSGNVDKLLVKHYLILELHRDKIEDYILTGELKLY